MCTASQCSSISLQLISSTHLRSASEIFCVEKNRRREYSVLLKFERHADNPVDITELTFSCCSLWSSSSFSFFLSSFHRRPISHHHYSNFYFFSTLLVSLVWLVLLCASFFFHPFDPNLLLICGSLLLLLPLHRLPIRVFFFSHFYNLLPVDHFFSFFLWTPFICLGRSIGLCLFFFRVGAKLRGFIVT